MVTPAKCLHQIVFRVISVTLHYPFRFNLNILLLFDIWRANASLTRIDNPMRKAQNSFWFYHINIFNAEPSEKNILIAREQPSNDTWIYYYTVNIAGKLHALLLIDALPLTFRLLFPVLPNKPIISIKKLCNLLQNYYVNCTNLLVYTGLKAVSLYKTCENYYKSPDLNYNT